MVRRQCGLVGLVTDLTTTLKTFLSSDTLLNLVAGVGFEPTTYQVMGLSIYRADLPRNKNGGGFGKKNFSIPDSLTPAGCKMRLAISGESTRRQLTPRRSSHVAVQTLPASTNTVNKFSAALWV